MQLTIAMKILTVIYFLFAPTLVHAQEEKAPEIIGDFLQHIIPATGLVSTLIIKDFKGTKQFAYSYGTNMVVTYILKYAIDKPRPRNNGGLSFPSGHTSAAFQGASFIQRRYGWSYGIPAYVTAAYVGWSRINAHKHDIWDVLAGAALGTGTSYLFVTPYKNKKKVEVSFLPAYSQGKFAFHAHLTF